MARNTRARAVSQRTWGRTSAVWAPSIMMARAASTRWVRGESCEKNRAAALVPSMENQTPESSSRGQEMRLRMPSASSSVRSRAETMSPRLMRQRAPAR